MQNKIYFAAAWFQSADTRSMFPAPAPPRPADFDPFPAPPRTVGKGGFPALPRPVKMIKTAGKLRGKI